MRFLSDYAAFGLGMLYALVSAYWATGGTVGLDAMGGERPGPVITVIWLTVVLKLVAAVLGLACGAGVGDSGCG